MYKSWSYGVFFGLAFWGSAVCAVELTVPPVSTVPVLRDPTQPAIYVVEEIKDKGVETGPHFVLSAIVSAGDQSFAIINHKRVKVGDAVGHGKVKAIGAYSVTLVSDAGEIVLHLFGRSVKEVSK